MKIKICGLFRDDDIDYVNEARPDFIGFVFAPSKRQVSPAEAGRLRRRLAEGIAPVGVFVNAPVEEIAALYRDGVISFAQLHGSEDEAYIARLREASASAAVSARAGAAGKRGNAAREALSVIKVVKSAELEQMFKEPAAQVPAGKDPMALAQAGIDAGTFASYSADYYLIDSGAGSGKTFDWNMLLPGTPCASWLRALGKPWFLAGGISLDNINTAMSFNPFCVDISGGAETGGIKDREKIIRLTQTAKKGNAHE